MNYTEENLIGTVFTDGFLHYKIVKISNDRVSLYKVHPQCFDVVTETGYEWLYTVEETIKNLNTGYWKPCCPIPEFLIFN